MRAVRSLAAATGVLALCGVGVGLIALERPAEAERAAVLALGACGEGSGPAGEPLPRGLMGAPLPRGLLEHCLRDAPDPEVERPAPAPVKECPYRALHGRVTVRSPADVRRPPGVIAL